MSDTEKTGQVENSSNSEVDQLIDPDAGLSDAERAAADRALLRKLDLRLIPWLTFLYLICFLDRTNIGNAKIAGLTTDVPMTTNQYDDTLSVFFVSYAVFEALANFLLKRLRASVFIPTIMIFWGACMLGMGFVNTWAELMVARWFLGVAEAGLFPGINYYLSCWYRRDEFGVRAAIFFSAAALSGSFGGLLAAAIQTLNGKRDTPGWAWIFIIEGACTIIVGLVSYLIVADFPDEATFLSSDDKARVVLRLKRDNQSSAEYEEFKMHYVWEAIKDWKTYAGMLLYMGPLMPLYAFSLFLPSIVENLSFTNPDAVIKNQLLSVPPYAVAAVATVAVGFWSDRVKKRGIFIMCIAPVGIVGFIMLLASTRPGVQYAGTFLGALGIYPPISLIIAWVANNTEGVYKRGIVLGMVIGWGNLNGVVSSNVYRWPPRYIAGHATIVGYMFICTFGGAVLMMYGLSRENKKRRNGERNHWVEGKTAEEIYMLGDQRPDFVYTL